MFDSNLIMVFRYPADVNFGVLSLDSSRDSVITLSNASDTALQILSYNLLDSNSGFTLVDTSLHTIPAMDSGTITVRFTASKRQTYFDTLRILTDEAASSNYKINLTGAGPYSTLALAQYAGELDARVGSTANEYVPLWNSGTGTAIIDSLWFSCSATFSVDLPKTPFIVAAADSCVLLISFTPDSVKYFSATLNVLSQDGGQAQSLLLGSGLAPLSVQPIALPNNTFSLLDVTPNPASTTATLRIGVTNDLEDVKINFYDATARLIQTQEIGNLSGGVQNIPLSLPPMDGVSFMRIVSGGETIGTIAIAILR